LNLEWLSDGASVQRSWKAHFVECHHILWWKVGRVKSKAPSCFCVTVNTVPYSTTANYLRYMAIPLYTTPRSYGPTVRDGARMIVVVAGTYYACCHAQVVESSTRPHETPSDRKPYNDRKECDAREGACQTDYTACLCRRGSFLQIEDPMQGERWWHSSHGLCCSSCEWPSTTRDIKTGDDELFHFHREPSTGRDRVAMRAYSEYCTPL